MMLANLIILFVAVINVAVADVFIKQATVGNHLRAALLTPWMAGAVVLYVTQILALTYFFAKGWDFSSTSMLQLVAYTLIVVVAGALIFGESLTPMRVGGIALAIAGLALMHG
jgi:multidrug transporter EmrE-like cation transporter